MDLRYPTRFPTDRQNCVEVEKIRADKHFQLTEHEQTLEQRALKWVCRVLGGFAHQACELAKVKQWTLAQVGSAVNEFCLELVRTANYRMSDGRLEWVDRVFGTSIRPDVRRAIQNSEEWQRHCDELSDIAESYNRRESPMLDSAKSISSREERLEDFKAQHNATYADIRYSAAVHRADFQKWRTGILKAESVMSGRIEDVLSGRRPLKAKPRQRRVE